MNDNYDNIWTENYNTSQDRKILKTGEIFQVPLYIP